MNFFLKEKKFLRLTHKNHWYDEDFIKNTIKNIFLKQFTKKTNISN